MSIEKFIDHLLEVFEREIGSINPNDNFRNYDEWDSITLLTLIAMLEDEYNVNIPRAKFEAIQTVQEMYDYVQANQ